MIFGRRPATARDIADPLSAGGDRYDPERHADYVELPEAARRMGASIEHVRELCRRRVLRSISLGAGVVLVEPAIVSGAT